MEDSELDAFFCELAYFFLSNELNDKGIVSMFVGYSLNHSGEVCRMLNLHTNKVSVTRDIKWFDLTDQSYMKLDKNQRDDLLSRASQNTNTSESFNIICMSEKKENSKVDEEEVNSDD